ncbi:MAG: hypothetical protein KA054_00100 [Candidatus Moranbacteria bacterium]|nr:hypothetical protein [Candidatus Moranbacteria bacterium]
MSFLEPFFPIAKTEKIHYLIGRVLLYLVFIFLVCFFALRIIFPAIPFSFNFNAPQSTKNTFLHPRSSATDQASLTNGKIMGKQTLIGNFESPQTFSRIRVSFALTNKSPDNARLKASLSRSYRSFFLPIDETPLASFEHPPLYRDTTNIYYAETDGSLKRFVSTEAYLSRYPEAFALPLATSPARFLPLSDEWIGFRPGSLLAFADGIFLVMNEREIRPFGNPEIFLSMGYRFDDVIQAHEEEIGIYERGRILSYGAPQSDGTLFQDKDSGAYLLVGDTKLKPITSPEYRKFILEKTTPIIASLTSRNIALSCVPMSSWFHKRTLTCDMPKNALPSEFGNAFQLSLKNNAPDIPVDLETITILLVTDRTQGNFALFMNQVFARLLNRFGQNT